MADAEDSKLGFKVVVSIKDFLEIVKRPTDFKYKFVTPTMKTFNLKGMIAVSARGRSRKGIYAGVTSVSGLKPDVKMSAAVRGSGGNKYYATDSYGPVGRATYTSMYVVDVNEFILQQGDLLCGGAMTIEVKFVFQNADVEVSIEVVPSLLLSLTG